MELLGENCLLSGNDGFIMEDGDPQLVNIASEQTEQNRTKQNTSNTEHNSGSLNY